MPSAIAATSVYSATGPHTLTGTVDDVVEVAHSSTLAVAGGTISLAFSMDRLTGDMALISKDSAGRELGGGFTVWLREGALVVTQESATETETLRVPDLVLSQYTTYHLSMSFGDDGLQIWLNGALVAAEPEFKQGLDLNNNPMLIGGTRSMRSNDSEDPHSLFKGTVSDVMVFDEQLSGADMRALASDIDPMLVMQANMAEMMGDLAPLFEQLHHGSDELKDILSDYGVGHHGHMMSPLNMIMRGNADHDVTGTMGADGINGGGGDDILKGGGGNDVMQGGYGNDKVYGGNGDDILDGGHGEDSLWGGAGNDLLISRGDAREPEIAYDPNRDEGDPLNELTNGKLYADQPIPGDDRLFGGAGADVFYFQTLINAKERYIEKHTRDDGTINWHGVAGENDKLHDHWVDHLGDDVVMDYSKAEGDRLVIEGHTTEIGSIRYGDANGDGIMDHSIISLYSDQGGGGGAHNDDLLGTITVYGDLVTEADISHTAAPAYGIVKSIKDLEEAITPTFASEDAGRIKAPKTGLPDASRLGLDTDETPEMAFVGTHSFDPEDRAPMIFDHADNLALRKGTIAFSFTTDTIYNYQSLFTKDASGYGQGHITAYISDVGTLVVRMQDDERSHYLQVDHAVEIGETYDFALTFGRKGAEIYLNGARVAYDEDIKINPADNEEAFVIGASGNSSTPGTADHINSYFSGTISDFAVFDKRLTGEQVFGDEIRDDYAYFNRSIADYGFGRNDNGVMVSSTTSRSTALGDEIEFMQFRDMTARVEDIQFGTARDDTMYGRDGADILLGRAGDDKLVGRANDDVLRGGAGDDEIFGGNGMDRMFGEADDDRMYGGNSTDFIFGGDGHDVIYGEGGSDRIYGGLGDDRIHGHTWDDGGKAKNDRVYFDGEFDDFTFSTDSWYDSNRGETVFQLTVTDSASGGSDGFYEGADRLRDVDYLVFADQVVAFDTLL